MDNKAIIIFLKYPELGRSKTRLAATVGAENALKVYQELLEHTHLITKDLNFDKYLFYDKVTPYKMPWSDDIYQTAYQVETDLGGRMSNAFEQLFQKGYERILIIGSDCYDLTQEILEEAMQKLKNKEVVIGPAKDGGYYLLGLTRWIPELFTDVKWSTDEVFKSTTETLEKLQISYDTTTILSDIDVYEDLPDSLKLLIS
ncbi:MAG: TIGR04282 family arsenosugar biosynthesis glycosyltransferase [Sphingobacteriales bacterium]|nr:TIGR04282 family arsenosugar biosynthesis glycosyltransferase [Sphingobacteriales bacterium]